MSKHTEGPWVTESTHETSNGLDEVINNNKGSCVGWAYRKEDAKLIRAAPEILALLKVAVCPDSNCRDGVVSTYRISGECDYHQCQWCYERDALITEIESE